jgi:hypothetical protein
MRPEKALADDGKAALIYQQIYNAAGLNLRFILIAVASIPFSMQLFRGSPAPPIAVSFDAWPDLQRVPSKRNQVKVSNELVAAVIYGNRDVDVRDIDLDSVRLSDGTGSGVPATMYHVARGYDENNDGRDDLKLDFKLEDLRTSGNLAQSSAILRVTGYLRNSKRPFWGEQTVTFVP